MKRSMQGRTDLQRLVRDNAVNANDMDRYIILFAEHAFMENLSCHFLLDYLDEWKEARHQRFLPASVPT